MRSAMMKRRQDDMIEDVWGPGLEWGPVYKRGPCWGAVLRIEGDLHKEKEPVKQVTGKPIGCCIHAADTTFKCVFPFLNVLSW